MMNKEYSLFAKEEIELLKENITPERLCVEYNINFYGKKLAQCPFSGHTDSTPSFGIDTEKNILKCFGCGKGGDIFKFVMEYKGCKFYKAGIMLAEMYINDFRIDYESKENNPLAIPVDHYYKALANNIELLRPFKRRFCADLKTIIHFKMGFCDNSLIKEINTETIKNLKNINIIKKNNKEFFKQYITIPIYNLEGKITQIFGYNPNTSKEYQKFYLKKISLDKNIIFPLNGIVNIQGLKNNNTWIICEAMIDMLTLWSHGFHNVTTCHGVHNFPNELKKLLIEQKPIKIVFAFDNDEAGNNAIPKLISEQNLDKYSDIYKVTTTNCKDINEYVSKEYNNILHNSKERTPTITKEIKNQIRNKIENFIKNEKLIAHKTDRNDLFSINKKIENEIKSKTTTPKKNITKKEPLKPAEFNNNKKNSFGERLKTARKLKNYSQVNLAKKTGLNQILISNYENNKYKPRLKTINKLATALDTSTDKLLGFEQNNNSKFWIKIREKIREIEKLDIILQKKLLKTIDSFIRIHKKN